MDQAVTGLNLFQASGEKDAPRLEGEIHIQTEAAGRAYRERLQEARRQRGRSGAARLVNREQKLGWRPKIRRFWSWQRDQQAPGPQGWSHRWQRCSATTEIATRRGSQKGRGDQKTQCQPQTASELVHVFEGQTDGIAPEARCMR